MTRGLAVAAGLLVGLLGGAAHRPLAAGSITVHAVVERPVVAKDPSRAVPWAVVLGLTRDDFEVRVDEHAVAIDSFSTSDDQIALVLLVDVSASVEFNRTDLLAPLRDSVVPALSAGDVVAFGRFGGTRLHIDDRFSVVPDAIKHAAEATLTRPRPSAVGPGETAQDSWVETSDTNGGFGLGGSPAWDGVYAAVDLLRSQPRRRAIILITDGRSTANARSLNEAILHATLNDAAVSVFDEAEDMMIRQEMGVARVRPSVFLQAIAEGTGGGYAKLFGPWTPARVDRKATQRWMGIALAQLVRDLHASYTLTFTSPARDGAAHRLEVRLKTPGHVVRARQAYLAPSALR